MSPPRQSRLLRILAAGLCAASALICTSCAFAQAASNDVWHRATLTGDWGGLRTRLKQDGITFNAHYASESAGIFVGPLRHTARYTQQLDLETLFDLDKLAGIHDALVQFTLTYRSGRSLSNDVLHNQFSVQELYGAGQNFRLAELNFQQDLDDHKIHYEIGWSPVGDDFARLPDFCKFQNGVICGHANAMTTNSGAHNFPTAQWGAHVKLHVTPAFYVATGVYLDNPDAGNANEGFNLSFKHTGEFVPVELGWHTGGDAMPGDYKIGAYYNSANTPDVYDDIDGMPAGLTGAPFIERNGRWGGYGIASQTVYSNPDTLRHLRLGIMGGMGDRATARYSWFWLAGGVWQGTFPGRSQDFVSFVIAYAHTNPRLTRFQRERDSVLPGAVGIQTYEGIVEVDYGAQVTPWLKLRPNLQYVIHPGGTGKIPDTLVAGLYAQVTF
ncbi:MAG: carbohydrate porin [Rhodanobacteraceae bacterium]|nr:MAG: carbohydrate porin [Rhodanobacteraceae bacterium]